MSGSKHSPPTAFPGARRQPISPRDSTYLAAGSAVAGLLAYVFFALASRSLGAERAAPISVLWSYWAVASAVLTFPVQHWIIRRFTSDKDESVVAAAMPSLFALVTVIAVITGFVAYLLRQELFGNETVVFPTIVAGITAGSFFMGIVRGVLSGRGRFLATAATLVTESGIRVLAAGGVAAAGGGAEAFAFTLVAGSVIGLAWAGTLRFARSSTASSGVRRSLALVSGLAGGSLIGQVALTGGPLVLAIAGGAPREVTSLFLALAVWRAPYLVALGVTPQITTILTHLAVEGPGSRVARVTRLTVLAVIGSAAAAAAAGATVLGPALRLAFGADVNMASVGLAGLGVGTMIALGNLILMLVLLAMGRSRVTTTAWIAAVVTSGVWLLLSAMTPVATVVIAFLVAELTAFLLLTGAVERSMSSAARASPYPS